MRFLQFRLDPTERFLRSCELHRQRIFDLANPKHKYLRLSLSNNLSNGTRSCSHAFDSKLLYGS